MLRVTIVICGVLLGLLAAAIVAAIGQDGVVHGVALLADRPWGFATLLDLKVGLLFVAAWLTVMESRPLYATLWIVALFALGNVVTLAFLLCRTRSVARFSELFLPSRPGD
ncbi:MAG: DUF1475 family protein [Gammaproteobacteria bacterium]|nr:DUF1475 family protein [Gammaproteobacteria bacterium]